ncbi:efflux RND transporter periplasmic adaptor subunit [Lysobacter sp. GX 14042]|uniref:efflux RND transporter periplasmic adaptor subunit n=1 Tax=Lysobacter sp. GX 14042 TaxID=2907155 RepID=UPI001F3490CC|nr:efflux RND transporter periplasmic adaptor subunit [Lysobacter sp. GX 14042]MCE7033318.1 efflux RND transporter periplasmic adaptor subunit [Lysobacter sp. GX 14042]
MPRFLLRSACVLLSITALVACGDEAPPRGGQEAVPVTSTEVSLQPWNDTVRALGTVKARESVTVTAKVSETVEKVHFESGEVVVAGAPLVTLSGERQQAELAEAQAQAAEAGQLYRRLAELDSSQLIARSQLDTQRATRDTAQARVEQIRAQLADRVVRAPFSGVLGTRQVSPGALVTPGTVIATLDAINRVFVDVPVPETVLSSLGVGQKLVALSAAWPDQVFEGVVEHIDTRIDPATRAITLRGAFANPEHQLRPGMLMQVTVVRPSREALVVPEISVVQVGSSSYVFRLRDDDTVERADVVVGNRVQGRAEIIDGLEAGDRIVVDGTGKLRAGMPVDATPVTGAPAPAMPESPEAGAAMPALAGNLR